MSHKTAREREEDQSSRRRAFHHVTTTTDWPDGRSRPKS